ncbi:MAG: DUF427 domain-containing protein [Candidatus Promineifilaceae bacterium]|nr:DUF427 domain-containing protein [Candidatus Promineifilaceae bacterium]
MTIGKNTIARTGLIEASERRVRVQVGDAFVADSKRPLRVWEHNKHPTYFFPKEDVRMVLLREVGQAGERIFWDLEVDARRVERAAYAYHDQPLLADYLTFIWYKMDHWYEEEQEVFVHARDPYTRVDVLPSARHVRVEVDGVTVAETERPSLLFETGLPTRYYLAEEDVEMSALTPTDTLTRCPYKGTASYWSVTVNGRRYDDLVWSYRDPIPESIGIKGLLAFYNERVDLYVDGELQERPQTAWS